MKDTDRELWARVAVLQAWVHRHSENERRLTRQSATEAIREVIKIAKEHYSPKELNVDIEIEQVANQILGPIARSR